MGVQICMKGYMTRELVSVQVYPLSALRKHAHAIYRVFFKAKIENFIGKMFEFFNIFTQNIHCGYMLEPPRRGSSNESPQCMF